MKLLKTSIALTIIFWVKTSKIRDNALELFKSFIANRTKLDLGAGKSIDKKAKCGVPQGSILGPTLFFI